MANLKKLRKQVEATKAKQSAPPKQKPLPMVDPGPQRVVDGVSAALRDVMGRGFARLEDLLQALVERPEATPVDEERIGKAVAAELKSLPERKITFPARKPVTYHATIERNSRGDMTGALIEPLK